MKVERSSPCKINLLLNILGKRPDGFHELETVLLPLRLFDQLALERAEREQGVSLSCTEPALPTDKTNLVARAAASFLALTGIKDGVRIHLEKRIPLAAGLGGGSGNAATTLLAMNDLFNRPLGQEALFDLAAQLGSDVPFFLQSKPALATGRGEEVTPLAPFPALRSLWALLVHPGFGVSTAWAYQNLARFPAALQGQRGRAKRLVEVLQEPNAGRALGEFYNALEAPVLDKYPILALYQEFLRANGAVAAMMSGSGSTTFAILEDELSARRVRDLFLGEFGSGLWTAIVRLGA